MHVTVAPNLGPVADLIGFTTGLLITSLLLVLTLRAAKVPGTPRANIVFAACAFLWSAGGLAHTALTASRMAAAEWLGPMAQALQFSGIAAFPIPVLAIWQPFAAQAWQKKAARIMLAGACVSAAAISFLLWRAPIPPVGVMHATGLNAVVFLSAGAAVCLRRASTPRSVYVPSLVIVFAVVGATLITTLTRHFHPGHGGYSSAGAHLVLLVLLCAFLLFARFRFADVFIRYGVRILIAGVWGSLLTLIAQSWSLLQLAHHAPSPAVAHVLLVMFVANAFLVSFTFMDERITTRLNRWLFHSPDYRVETRKLTNRLRHLHTEAEVARAVEDAAMRPLELKAARLAALEELPRLSWPAGLLEGETVELGFGDPLRKALDEAGKGEIEVAVPVSSGGKVSHLLLVAPGFSRPGLVTHDLNYLDGVATQCSHRLEALRREQEAVERQSRESLLQQQVTEAELRALRAQINPHFLFNSLNTIADLIVRDPARAEVMTLRLASVFRHVLAHSCRPLATVREEIEFLRTYLHIEEARFGDRLTVEIEMDPSVAGALIPSLIMQPLVENSLKHGLGPKPGPGHLWITARPLGDQVELQVEDDGIGPGSSTRGESPGLGLTNIAERLNTMYHDRASVRLESREGGGSRARVLIPRAEVGAV